MLAHLVLGDLLQRARGEAFAAQASVTHARNTGIPCAPALAPLPLTFSMKLRASPPLLLLADVDMLKMAGSADLNEI